MPAKTILITGLGGTVGSGMLESLPSDTEVLHLGTKPIQHPKVSYIPADFTDPQAEWNIPERKIDAIVHLSQSPEYRQFPQKALNVFNVNTYSTLRLLDLALKRNIPQFVYASTGGVYPFHEEAHTEDAPLKWQNTGFYTGSKLCSELILDSYKDLLLNKLIRFFFVYGPMQPAGMLIPRLLSTVNEGRAITLFGHDGLKINPIYYLDAGRAIWQLLEKEEGLTLNIGGDEVLSLRQIGEIMGEVLEKEAKFEVKEVDPSNPQALLGDITYLKENIYAPQVSFREGIKKMLSHAF